MVIIEVEKGSALKKYWLYDQLFCAWMNGKVTLAGTRKLQTQFSKKPLRVTQFDSNMYVLNTDLDGFLDLRTGKMQCKLSNLIFEDSSTKQ